jgi:arylsulfotransferase ASST
LKSLPRRRFVRGIIAWLSVCALAAGTPAIAAAADDPTTRQDVPTPVQVLQRSPGTAPGLLFLTPQSLLDQYQHGPQILDDQGRVVWFHKVPDGLYASNFRPAVYHGKPVLVWWEGTANNQGVSSGVGYIADRNYRIIATVKSPDYAVDLHEFRLTARGTVLCIISREIAADLRPFGGSADGSVRDDGIQEIDVATGRAVNTWWASEHVALSDTHGYLDPTKTKMAFMHMNSVSLDTDGNYLVSGRETWAVYKVDRRTGKIIWHLGGKSSDFTMGDGATFAWQHDAEPQGDNVYRILDNETTGRYANADQSRVVWIKVDLRRKTATLLREQKYPGGILDGAEGGSQSLPNGDTLVSWGGAGRVSEFAPNGTLLYDVALPPQHSTYRAYRFPWHSRPFTGPTITVAGDSTTAHAVWNGATDVARWRIMGGTDKHHLRRIAEAAWNGYDTSAALPTRPPYLQVQALDRTGRVMATSAVTPTAG